MKDNFQDIINNDNVLHWKPITVVENEVGDKLLHTIMKNKYALPYQLGRYDLEYLKGLRDAGINGAEELINAIGIHGHIEIF